MLKTASTNELARRRRMSFFELRRADLPDSDDKVTAKAEAAKPVATLSEAEIRIIREHARRELRDRGTDKGFVPPQLPVQPTEVSEKQPNPSQ